MRTKKITSIIPVLLLILTLLSPSVMATAETEKKLENTLSDESVKPDINTDELYSVMNKGDLITQNGKFTEESLRIYNTAYGNAMAAVFYGKSQEEADNAKAELEAAINGLVPLNQSTASAPEVSYCLLGDANEDSKVNIRDTTAIQKHIANLITLTAKGISAADANGDGVVNIKDSTDVQKHLAGFSVSDKIGKEKEFLSTPVTTVNLTEATVSTAEVVTTEPAESTVPTEPTEPTETTQVTSSTDATKFTEISTTGADDFYDSVDDLLFWIETAEEYLAPGNNYIDSTASELQSEIDNAKELYNSGTATYNETTAQIKALQDAIDGLVTPDLDRDELWATIERGIEIVENGNFTTASYEAYSIAYSEAMGAYHYGDTQEEIDNAKAQLEVAINGLVPVAGISFTIAEEFRINGYGSDSDKTELHLITSRARMEAVIAKVQGSEYGSLYTTPTISEKYNDAYFENNSLIISLNVVGGSCCTQTVDRITVEGDTLTVHRTIYKPEIVLCDMNYQYILMEVSKSDTENVKSLTDNTIVALIGEDTTDPTDNTPIGETVTVYFSNSQYWSDVNIHFWGGTYSTSWPGSEMEYVEHNIYGQDVYRLSIPADTTGIVFNEGVNQAQTVDIVTGISDGYGFYPTEVSQGKWKVESYIYEDKEPTTTVIIPETTTPEETQGEKREIPFNISEEFRVQYYGSDNTELYLIRSVAEFETVLSKIEGETDGYLYTKPAISEKYNDEYFMSDSLIISLNVVGGSCCTQSIDRITVEGNILTVHRTLYKPQNVLCDMNYQYVLIEVSNTDIADITALENHNTYITIE